MQVVIVEQPGDVASFAASRISDVVARVAASGKRAVLGVATGSSPLGTYRALAELVSRGHLDTTGVSAFALDEYVGLDYAHPESYHSVVTRTVTEPLALDPRRVHVPDGLADDLPAACSRYEEQIRAAGGIDVQLLGIGANGHIGFNEPTSSLNSRTRLKTLAKRTRDDNARFFDSPDQVPIHCLTQGLATILDARQALLVAQGVGKAEAIAAAVEGPVSAMCPASVLQLHSHATVVVDEAAASRLRLRDYYSYVLTNLPSGDR
ncbi:glucosamine-6-phosphate deaminase [Rarobacter faecitabidus]|uniref:Glucosamine-6-phosphate deaminase n=1 Tax=Rarobacter faecitabidus TaxID=13243 RepID=A0A542ZX50_RARFA|nr:glucosamine-6-phosphate deaminase [Rarobacter faecitabidus]TQL64879.1 glucosamine-6-phosphate deaminase [Rarobacter faecitabidus]